PFEYLCPFLPQTFLGRSVGLPAPLGEPDRSNEEGEPERPRRQRPGPSPALGIQKRETQEQTGQHPGEPVGSQACHSTPARKDGPLALCRLALTKKCGRQ